MILSIKQLYKSYQGSGGVLPILKGVNCNINKGETLAILGPSGSGKSTLLGLMCGLDRPDSGTVELDGKNIFSMSEAELTSYRAEKVGIIFQQYHLVPHLTALENVLLPMEIQGKPDSEKAKKLLHEVGLGERMEHFPSELSGGECQRVAIARSLALSPALLLGDEPSGSLDMATGEQVVDLLFRVVKANQQTMILVTHSMDLAARCDRRLKLDHGTLVEC